jgi:methionyl-tRNA formyltransferase
MTPPTYILAGCKPWHRAAFDDLSARFPGHWHFAATQADLATDRVAALQPRYIFFLHWSWKVPATITDRWECICFHVGDLPKDRGGSPIQNQIARGKRSSFLSVLRMEQEIDAGPIYRKIPFSLEGGAEEIYLRATRESIAVVEWMVREEPQATPQVGTPEVHARRKPEQSRLDGTQTDLLAVHDLIRMLDADGYPKAFLDVGNLRLEFTRSALYAEQLQADVRITLKPIAKDEPKR